jgi:TRAP-type mannitol/chloroaromatic compound transport system permease large subunit
MPRLYITHMGIRADLQKGIAKPEWELSTQDIIRGVLPYEGLITLALGLCIAFPQILLWLPAQMVS